MRRSPKLDRRFVLQERVLVADGAGGFSHSWTDLGTLPASLQSRAGTEKIISGRTVYNITHKAVVRAAPPGAPSRPQADQRFKDGVRIFNILSVTELNGNDQFLECWVKEGTEE